MTVPIGFGLCSKRRPGGLSAMLAILLGVCAALCWSLHDLVARAYAARIGAFRMAGLVMVAGAVLLVAIVAWRGTIWSSSWTGIVESLLLGVATGIGVGGLFRAFSLGPISLVGPVTAAYPVLVVGWGVVNGLEPSALQWAAVAATLAGALIVARSGHEDGGINAVEPGKLPLLFLFCAMSMLGYACTVVIGQRAGVSLGEIESTFLSRFTAMATLLPFILGEGRPAPLKPRHWLGILAMGGLDAVGVIAINATGGMDGSEFTAVGISSYGAIAVILAMLVLKEKVSPGQWLGIAMIVGGVATLSLSQ